MRVSEAANAFFRRVFLKQAKNVFLAVPFKAPSEKKEVYFEGLNLSLLLQKEISAVQESLRDLEEIQKLLLTRSPPAVLRRLKPLSSSLGDPSLKEFASHLELRALILEEQLKQKHALQKKPLSE